MAEPFWKGKRILVAGGAGMIGCHLARALLAKGCEIIIADNLSSGHLKNIEDIKDKMQVEIAYLQEKNICKKVTKGVDYVFQLAANMGGIGYITKIGADIMRDNILINTNMLQASVENGVKRFFFASSACVYPAHLQMSEEVRPLKEEDTIPANPNEFYGWEKLMTEKLCEAYYKDYGLEVRIARFHNIFGEAYTAFDPERGKAPAHLIAKTICYPKEKFIVWGDGKQTRSFLYVGDCVEGILKLMESNYPEPVNIGSDRLISINDMVKILAEISGKDIRVEYDLSKPQGVRGRNADLTLVRRVLGWEPKISLEEGLRRMYKWAEERWAEIEKIEEQRK